MEPSEQSAPAGNALASHDHSSISPSAYTLLLMKRHTAIPYVREAADLVESKLRQAQSSEPESAVPNAAGPDTAGATKPAAEPANDWARHWSTSSPCRRSMSCMEEEKWRSAGIASIFDR